ncbi:MAG: hypothetical protein K8R64_08145 [Methanosarcinaceae archaeon]|nr:hypothetical protein [Methanosarcinaceae archaeon]
MDNDWQIDLDIPDIGTMITLMSTAICSAIIGAAEISYTMMWITSAYERHGKDFFIDLINAQSLTWTAEFVIVAGSLILCSAIIFLLTTTIALIDLNRVKNNKKNRIRIIFVLFFIGLALLFMALVSGLLLRYI